MEIDGQWNMKNGELRGDDDDASYFSRSAKAYTAGVELEEKRNQTTNEER